MRSQIWQVMVTEGEKGEKEKTTSELRIQMVV